MLTREDVIEKLRSGELTPQDIAANGWMCSVTAAYQQDKAAERRLYQTQRI